MAPQKPRSPISFRRARPDASNTDSHPSGSIPPYLMQQPQFGTNPQFSQSPQYSAGPLAAQPQQYAMTGVPPQMQHMYAQAPQQFGGQHQSYMQHPQQQQQRSPSSSMLPQHGHHGVVQSYSQQHRQQQAFQQQQQQQQLFMEQQQRMMMQMHIQQQQQLQQQHQPQSAPGGGAPVWFQQLQHPMPMQAGQTPQMPPHSFPAGANVGYDGSPQSSPRKAAAKVQSRRQMLSTIPEPAAAPPQPPYSQMHPGYPPASFSQPMHSQIPIPYQQSQAQSALSQQFPASISTQQPHTRSHSQPLPARTKRRDPTSAAAPSTRPDILSKAYTLTPKPEQKAPMTTEERYATYRAGPGSEDRGKVDYTPYSLNDWENLKKRDSEMKMPRGTGPRREDEDFKKAQSKMYRRLEYGEKIHQLREEAISGSTTSSWTRYSS
ncbi:uncharacterized protein EV422DRAFT_619371 [Fimicolochytrium jonesii]|uniref:uncharacterized protein n=1 Tax=Fimicolochytrium jonesii TaxID=1396493 RepID=UPI0022FDC0EF|nr:uncharacterized protein EV422DRAFT_619371 [Fimicolochytrium jonesii]KAI8822247.1 hypothetical protein EV422DRAFT_619371 [Fimicolochytrium jonesii]